ncbi:MULTISPECIES: tagaturonate reductase [Arcicella]|uniref:Tagaturonate reductase n=1 Tax=Arcicella lustrica TaxID=2984196 RepID=A0ABU5SGE6_9BACT|nr:tagaturonate reductase [Arcicella sp. DC25W]MEA5426357.1 tagaturonate reductase [Arcicella sp. DC25W]
MNQKLTREYLASNAENLSKLVELPNDKIFELPEKVLQFGTGVLLRGLCDYFIDKANKKGVFNGRIVVVKSTDKGGTDDFNEQDGLFTHAVKGLENGQPVEEYIINASISRTISARSQWNEILACAKNPEMQVIISNTTEVGIALVENDKITNTPPQSFPVKLLAFLYERWKEFKGSAKSGMVIIPTELIVGNGDKLQEIVLEQAHRNGLEPEFIEWLENHNSFCNSLVDRIVPGKPDKEICEELEKKFSYQDDLMILSEVYRLWAIQGDEKIRKVLSFASADSGVIIERDIEVYRELKLRMLNGTHTLTCGMAYLLGFRLVKDVMSNSYLSKIITNMMLGEVSLAIPYKIDPKVKDRFGRMVLDRFRNPFLQHKLLDITVQYTAKMKMRNIPILLQYYREFGKAPELFAMGFAAYLQFMKAEKEVNGNYFGESNGEYYPINCNFAPYFYEAWENFDLDKVLSNRSLWGEDLTQLEGFSDAVRKYL